MDHEVHEAPMIAIKYVPLIMTNIAIENGPVEIVDFPSYNMVMFHSFFGTVYQAGYELSLLYHKQGIKGLGDLKITLDLFGIFWDDSEGINFDS